MSEYHKLCGKSVGHNTHWWGEHPEHFCQGWGEGGPITADDIPAHLTVEIALNQYERLLKAWDWATRNGWDGKTP